MFFPRFIVPTRDSSFFLARRFDFRQRLLRTPNDVFELSQQLGPRLRVDRTEADVAFGEGSSVVEVQTVMIRQAEELLASRRRKRKTGRWRVAMATSTSARQFDNSVAKALRLGAGSFRAGAF